MSTINSQNIPAGPKWARNDDSVGQTDESIYRPRMFQKKWRRQARITSRCTCMSRHSLVFVKCLRDNSACKRNGRLHLRWHGVVYSWFIYWLFVLWLWRNEPWRARIGRTKCKQLDLVVIDVNESWRKLWGTELKCERNCDNQTLLTWLQICLLRISLKYCITSNVRQFGSRRSIITVED